MKPFTLATKITLLRILITFLAILFFYLPSTNRVLGLPLNYNYLLALLGFILAMALDAWDGYLARKHGEVTELGAFLDPLVDKLTIIFFLVCLTDKHIIPAWLALLLIFRDVLISSFRGLAVSKGVSIPAKLSGKLKTLFQTLGIALGILTLAQLDFLSYDFNLKLTFYTLLLALIVSYISGILIVLKNHKKVF